MRRELGSLSDRVFDLVVIGGGIHGACAAWDAALRGLSVALVEREDFGGATSANSQKIVHGGFRYLQHGDAARLRESVRERRALLRVAPHLVAPLPFLLPTYRWGLQMRPALRAALAVYDVLAADRNAGITDPCRWVPAGRMVSRRECLRLAPGLSGEAITGGAVWHDAQVYNAERLTLAFVRSAAEEGACAANYVRVTGLRPSGARLLRIGARDELTGRDVELHGRVVISAGGPWTGQVLALAGSARPLQPRPLAKGICMVTKPIVNGCAVSVLPPGRNGRAATRRLYLTPWRGRTIVGCAYSSPAAQTTQECRATEDEVAALIDSTNAAYPGARLRRDDVVFVHAGLLPRSGAPAHAGAEALEDRPRIVDHAREGLPGLISVIGVKYTTARDVAEQAVTLAMRRLGRRAAPSRSATTSVHGGACERFEAFLQEAQGWQAAALGADVITQLVRNYGSAYGRVLDFHAADAGWRGRLSPVASVLKAEVVHAVREEMAQRLGDVVFRRTELGTAGHPGREALRACAALMAEELGWDASRMDRELEAVEGTFAEHGARAPEGGETAPAQVAVGEEHAR